jgi:exodeoxyribonuclease VII small subunit
MPPKMTGYVFKPLLNSTTMTKAKTPASNAPASYEAALKELEAMVAQMESGQLPLADLLSGYQRGAELLAFCRAQLDAVEQQIQVLDNGVLKPWSAA